MNESRWRNGLHYCAINSEAFIYGSAITECWEDVDGLFWVNNGEYGSRVNYCPMCGAKAPMQFAHVPSIYDEPEPSYADAVWFFDRNARQKATP